MVSLLLFDIYAENTIECKIILTWNLSNFINLVGHHRQEFMFSVTL